MICLSILTERWFAPSVRGKALGVATVASGIGAMILNPVTAMVIEKASYSGGFIFFAILALIPIPFVLAFWKDYPADAGVDRVGAADAAHESLVLMGDSAGGAIALALTQYLKKNSLPMPGRLILISPWLDARCDNPQIDELGIEAIDPMLTKQFYLAAQYWADGLPLDDPLISPAYGPLDGLPPITLYTGTREIFWPDAVKFNEKAKRCGADVDYREWDGMNHVCESGRCIPREGD